DKNNLNKARENRIDELKKTQTDETYDKIRQSISRETDIDKLINNGYWYNQILRNQDLTEDQKVKLNRDRIDKLKELSDKYYDQISKDIQSTDDYRQLNDSGLIDQILQQKRRGRLDLFLKEKALSDYDNYNKQINNYYNWQLVHLLTNDSPLTNNIMNLNQTLLSPEKDKNVLIELRKLKYNNLLYDLIKENMEEDTDK
ncbi:1677_t:CDS:2, partial [Racocetra fulgida]